VAALEQSLRARWRPAAERLYANWLTDVVARKSRHAAAAARNASAAPVDRPPAFAERRRRTDPSGHFTGPRDRRIPVRA
jgi:hypothetical protein